MSGAVALVIAGASQAVMSAPVVEHGAAPAPILEHALSIAVPSVDGLRGLTASFEQFVPGRHVSVAVSAALRESATGDYTGVRAGGGAELRWYWRAAHEAALARQPAGSMVGWFAGARLDLALDAIHDDVDAHWLPTTIETDAKLLLGYRFVPWRNLEVSWNENGISQVLPTPSPSKLR